MKNSLKTAGFAVAGAMIAGTASAQISGTFVNAESGVNTFLASDGVSPFADTSSTGTLWRDETGNLRGIEGGFAYSPNAGDALIVTEITGLTAGQSYDINFVFGDLLFAGPISFNAGLDSQNLIAFDGASTANHIGTDTGVNGDDTFNGLFVVDIFEVGLGTAVADSNGVVQVFAAPSGANTQWVYQGVAFTAVPEPSSLALLGLGGLALIRRRR